MDREKQIEEMAKVIEITEQISRDAHCGFPSPIMYAKDLYWHGYRKQSDIIDEFAERLKDAPIKCGLPLLGLHTKEEIEEYFNGIMLQVRDAIDGIVDQMKGGE